MVDLKRYKHVLVTGATGFIGAHIVDELLRRGIRVRGAVRSLAKGEAMLKARPQFSEMLDFVIVRDFEQLNDTPDLGIFDEAVKGVDGIIHTASPLNYAATNNERELILPAINSVRALLSAAAEASPPIRRIVITSSFASILDSNRHAPSTPYFTYTAADWNPLTYEEAADPSTSPVIAYRGSKKFAELAAWDVVRERKPAFDVVTICPPMTFGPVVNPVSKAVELNETNATLWKAVESALEGKPLPVARVPFWVDVRDVAKAHVEALLRPEAGGKRFLVAAPERFSYGLAVKIVKGEFEWAEGAQEGDQEIDESYGLDGETAAKELGLTYRSLKETVTELVGQVARMEGRA